MMNQIVNSSGDRLFAFDNTYARELEGFYVPWTAAQVARPRLIKFNRQLAEELGLDADALDTDEGARIFAGNETPEGALPLAQAYAGHQFGGFVPQLGDGRALLIGEVIDRYGRRRDIQLKGSGPTPFSRAGDGRAALGPVLREYVIGEAMHALRIPTTRALAAVITGEPVYRERALPGAVLTRVAASHVRVGTFQFVAARGEQEKLARLADYVIDRHYPALNDDASVTFSYLVSDGTVSVAGSATLDILPVNDDPAGSDASIVVAEDGQHVFSAGDFGFSDVEGHALQAVLITAVPSQGTLRLNGQTVGADTEVSADQLAQLVFAPAANASAVTDRRWVFIRIGFLR